MRPFARNRSRIIFVSIFIGYLLLSVPGLSDEFKVISFKKDDLDISAITNSKKRLDDNDIPCSIIKVRSDITNLRFSASNPVVGNVELINGEYWVYVSEGTRQLYIFTEGFIKFSYTFPIPIDKASVYVMVLTSKTGLRLDEGKGILLLTSEPDSVEVRIDGFPDLIKTTPCSFNNYREGKYRFFFSRYRYYPLDSVLIIEKETTKQIEIALKPAWGNLIVDLGETSVIVEIANKTYTGKRIELCGVDKGLDPGKYHLKIIKNNYYDRQFDIEIKESDTILLNVKMEPLITSVNFNSKPGGANVFIDGNYAGKTPFYVDSVIVGNHKVRFFLDGYADYVKNVLFKYDTLNELFVQMKNRFRVTLESVPSHAEIWINGDYAGKTPLKTELLNGENNIKLVKKNFETFTKTIDVSKEGVRLFHLEKQKYTLSITTRPSGATVKINGKNMGKTPATLTLPYGHHKVSFKTERHFPRKKKINLDEDMDISYRLARTVAGYIGVAYIMDEAEYSLLKVGIDFGWTYKNAPRLLTGVGLFYNEAENIDFDDVRNINVTDYEPLDIEHLQTDGFIEKSLYAPFLRMGYLITKRPVKLTITASILYYHVSGYNVYISDKDYEGSYGLPLDPEQNFYDDQFLIDRWELVYSAGLKLFMGYIYIGADYCFPDYYNNKTPGFIFSAGVCF